MIFWKLILTLITVCILPLASMASCPDNTSLQKVSYTNQIATDALNTVKIDIRDVVGIEFIKPVQVAPSSLKQGCRHSSIIDALIAIDVSHKDGNKRYCVKVNQLVFNLPQVAPKNEIEIVANTQCQ